MTRGRTLGQAAYKSSAGGGAAGWLHLTLVLERAPAELLPGGGPALHRGKTHFLPVRGTGSCQESTLCEVVLAEFRMMRSCFASLSPSPL